MTDYLNSLVGIDLPVWAYIAAAAVLIVLVLLVIWFIQARIFRARLRRIISTQDEALTSEALREFERHYPPEKLLRYSKRMEKYSREMGPRVVRETGLAGKWMEKLVSSASPSPVDLRRVLLFCQDSSIFRAFITAGQHPRLQKDFTDWMQGEGDEKVLRLLAESCRGEDFNPFFDKPFLEKNAALLRELTGEPEWPARYFAYRTLLFKPLQGEASSAGGEYLTERNMDDGLLDPHPLVRKILTEKFFSGEYKTWNTLWDKLIHDPVFEVREMARRRITKEFMARYSPKDASLNDDESARVLELLDPCCQEDKNFAILSLESSSKSISFPAAFFLDKCGVLSSLLEKTTLDDSTAMDHTVSLLRKALEVSVSGFLKDYPTGDGAPLLAAARLLSDPGDTEACALGTQDDICCLEKKVFEFFKGRKFEPTSIEIYKKTLDAVVNNGSVKSQEILAEELLRREDDKDFLELLLPRIPGKAEGLFCPILFRFLENIGFPARDNLVQTLGTFTPGAVLPKVFQILDGSRIEYPHIVRISALKILGLMRLPFCLLRILETLPTLTLEEAEEFACLIAEYPEDVFEGKVRLLFALPDAKIRASLITILPVTKNEKFLKEIRSSLKDVDPDVRVAAIKSLLRFGEIKLLNQETSMLHDPIERVRVTTADVISRHGNAAAMEILKKIISDPNETSVVKLSVIAGLGQSTSAEGIDILVSVLDPSSDFSAENSADNTAELRECAVKALAMRVTRRDITQLIEIFRDAEPQMRENLIPVFKAQGKKAEPQILEILKDEVASFKPYLVKILEETGYVDEAKRHLLNRNVEVRREAALFLSLLDTLPAFRGLVLAAKDPDQEVRVCVVKALEKLKSSHSQEVLEKLKDDPDSRIRKYTYWALERLDSLKME